MRITLQGSGRDPGCIKEKRPTGAHNSDVAREMSCKLMSIKCGVKLTSRKQHGAGSARQEASPCLRNCCVNTHKSF